MDGSKNRSERHAPRHARRLGPQNAELGRRHGYGIAKWIEETTDEAVLVEEGSLYPALYRMERRGLIEAEWGTSELGRKAKFYRITPKGRRQLAADTEQWARFAAGVSKVLLPA